MPPLLTIEKSVFTAVCDKDKKRAQQFASRYGVKAYGDVKEMVIKEKLDVVTVCIPHPTGKSLISSLKWHEKQRKEDSMKINPPIYGRSTFY